jgi:RNA polymerase-binding protein DksA
MTTPSLSWSVEVAKKTTAKRATSPKSPKMKAVRPPAKASKAAAKPTKPKGQAVRLALKSGKPLSARQVATGGANLTLTNSTALDNGFPARLPEAELKKVKSGLTKRDLEHYRGLLMQKRAEILGDVASLETDARNNSGGNLSNMPLHMADIGTDNYEKEFTLGLVESDRKLLLELNEALMRIRNGTFGVCVATGKPIGKPRLDARPWARYCIEVARDMERRGLAI